MSIRSLLLVMVMSTSFTFAWDGQRQGFLLGVGAGAQQTSMGFDAEDKYDAQNTTMLLPALTSRLGYAWNNNNAIVLHSVSAGIMNRSIGYGGLNYHNWTSENVNSNQWYGGIGVLTLSVNESRKGMDPQPTDFGFGFNFGYGLEVASHTSVEINAFIGSVTDNDWNFSPLNDKWEKGNNKEKLLVTGLSVSINLLGY